MRISNTPGPTTVESPSARTGGRWKRRAGALALSAALVGAMPAATAGASAAQATQSRAAAVAAADMVQRGHYFWKSDCEHAGQLGIASGQYEYYECRDGGPFP